MAWGTASWVCVDSMSDTGMESAVFPIHLSLWVKHLSRRGHRRQDRHCFHDNGNFPFLSDLCGALVWDKDFKWQCAGPAENIPVGNTRSVHNALFNCSLQSIVTLLCRSLCLLIVYLRIFEELLLGLHPHLQSKSVHSLLFLSKVVLVVRAAGRVSEFLYFTQQIKERRLESHGCLQR